MAITGAERRAVTAALLLALGGCIRSEVSVPSAPSAGGGPGAEPSLRIGLAVAAPTLEVAGSAGLLVTSSLPDADASDWFVVDPATGTPRVLPWLHGIPNPIGYSPAE